MAVIVPIIIPQESQQSKELACQSFMRGYDSKTATVAESKDYARCVGILHPEPMPEGAAIILKVLFVCILLGLSAGVLKGWREEGAVGALFAGVLGGFIPIILFAIIGAVVFMLSFLFR